MVGPAVKDDASGLATAGAAGTNCLSASLDGAGAKAGSDRPIVGEEAGGSVNAPGTAWRPLEGCAGVEAS
jgi:hypothetical protein